MSVFDALIIAFVEGITEFLPISSTGHMALTAAVLNVEKEAFTKLFIESIQFGAIISVLVVYYKKFFDFRSYKFYLKLFIAFIPGALGGILFKDYIEKTLENPLFVSLVMVFGGIILLFVDDWFKKPEISKVENISYKKASVIGLFQVLSVVLPGLSRSAATIIGGMHQKLTRNLAAEFSFFLAVPTLSGAFAKSIWDARMEAPDLLNSHNILLLILGNAVAFFVAILAIKTFIAYLQNHGFKLFGWYRVIIGGFIVVLLMLGYNLAI